MHVERSDWGGAFAVTVAAYKLGFLRDNDVVGGDANAAKKSMTTAPYLGIPSSRELAFE